MALTSIRTEYPIASIEVQAYTIPTQSPSDGTLEWDATTLVYVEVQAGAQKGIGYTYADVATAKLIDATLRKCLLGADAMRISARWNDMTNVTRNLGRDGITSMAISAVDVALWDLKGKLLSQPVCALFGAARERVPIYGSGGFTSYTIEQLCAQLHGWVADGIPRVKMKVGREPVEDSKRVAATRSAVGANAELFIDANGAYSRKQALALARHFAEQDVIWFEEPVFRGDYEGTRLLRDRAPAGMDVSIGEYGYGLYEFARMLDAQCVDVLQADATRCGGFSGLLPVDALCQTKMMPLSTHCAPYLHLHAALACKQLRHSKYFFDHVRIEKMLFDGTTEPVGGTLAVDRGRPGIGLEFKHADAQRYLV